MVAADKATSLDGSTCDLLFENTAGSGDTVGRSVDELAALIDATGGDPRVGICIDTLHLWASGVSFATVEKADELVASLDRGVGLGRLRCLHLNDSKTPFASRRDRHELVGKGSLGPEPFRRIMTDPRFVAVPKVLETPKGDDEVTNDRESLLLLREMAG